MGLPTHRPLNELTNVATSSGAIKRTRFMESALRELAVTLCLGNHLLLLAAGGRWFGTVGFGMGIAVMFPP
jgi:hypothetical protein